MIDHIDFDKRKFYNILIYSFFNLKVILDLFSILDYLLLYLC